MVENLQVICLGIVLNHNNEVLIVQRAKEEKGIGDAKLSWVFPGGKLETNETKEVAAVREILEETGYKVEVKSVISERQHPQFPVYVYYLGCELIEDGVVSPSQNEEIKQIIWVDPKELKNYFTTNLDSQVSKYLGLSG